MIIGGSGSKKTNALLNLINEQHDIDKTYLYAKDLNEPRYEYLIKIWENAGINHLNDSNTFIVCFNTMDDVDKNINDYNPSRRWKILIVFDDMIADIMTNKEFKAIIKELFIKYFTCFYHAVLFFCSRRCQIKFNTLFDHENKQQKRIAKYCN